MANQRASRMRHYRDRYQVFKCGVPPYITSAYDRSAGSASTRRAAEFEAGAACEPVMINVESACSAQSPRARKRRSWAGKLDREAEAMHIRPRKTQIDAAAALFALGAE